MTYWLVYWLVLGWFVLVDWLVNVIVFIRNCVTVSFCHKAFRMQQLLNINGLCGTSC